MTPNKNPQEILSKSSLHIERDRLIKVKNRTVKCISKKETECQYRVKAVFEKYHNKWLPSLKTKKEWKGVVGSRKYKVLVKIVEDHKGSYKQICCVDSLDPRWGMGLVYFVLDASLIIELGPLLA